MQALIFRRPEDKLCWHIDDEYYFGNDFLVAPVMNSENRRDVYLPEGKWVNFFTGERLEGGRWLKNLEKLLRNAVYGNLKLMKKTLNEKQYADYAREHQRPLYRIVRKHHR